YLGNGGQWISGAQAAGIPTSLTPTEGSVVVFNGPRYSVYGHVALVRSVIYGGGAEVGLVVWERNLDEMGGFDVRLVALGSGSEIAGYIPPGA
ncbi:MAG: CHAP domain-containing protein, partial [Candidatus Dormibacteraeota bacterium]|nr:CHAP domain-containing protein [Candidatus Dormibacteraeota bacterium]